MKGNGQLFILINFTAVFWQDYRILSEGESGRQATNKGAKTVADGDKRHTERKKQVEIMRNEWREPCAFIKLLYSDCVYFLLMPHSVREMLESN